MTQRCRLWRRSLRGAAAVMVAASVLTIAVAPASAEPDVLLCESYTGANPTFSQLISDTARFLVATQDTLSQQSGTVAPLPPPEAQQAAAEVAEPVRGQFDRMPEGAAAKFTSWVCSVQLSNEQLANAGVDPEMRNPIMANARGHHLVAGLSLCKDLENGSSITVENLNATEDELRDALIHTLCPYAG